VKETYPSLPLSLAKTNKFQTIEEEVIK